MTCFGRFRIVACLSLSLLAATMLSRALPAQEDPSGEWSPRFDEDQRERLAGAEIGDYLGLPINDAARLRADSWEATLVELPEHQCRAHGSDYGWRGPSNLSIWKESGQGHSSCERVSHAPFSLWSRADDLDGWAPTSSRLRAAHVGRFFDGTVGGRHARHHDHSLELHT
jgi:hypothetical protein